MAGRSLDKRSRPDHVGNHVNRAAARRRKRMARIVGAGRRACGGIIVLNMIDDMHACRCAAEELQEFGVLGGPACAVVRPSVARRLDLAAPPKSVIAEVTLLAAVT